MQFVVGTSDTYLSATFTKCFVEKMLSEPERERNFYYRFSLGEFYATGYLDCANVNRQLDIFANSSFVAFEYRAFGIYT